MKSQDIRSTFLNFFESKTHKIVPSAPMVLRDDPTLMFVNAGMVPFKEFFLGQKKVVNSRVADSQKCLRVSGKHNDLEEVGKDTYHHTMFEMLGNWSFGDYFKEEAIAWAWELLTEVYKIDKDILYVTIFEGDEKEGLAKDTEAYNIWKKYIAEDRILLGNKKDNFWEMGAQGPCGPCSEIHVDIRSAEDKEKVSGASLVNLDHPHVVEVWNLVFMQYNRKANGNLENLPATHIDTGMGFERLCMVLQNVQSNYDTDVFTPLIQKIVNITGVAYEKDEETDIAIRVIADHVRAVAFAIADGQLPSNTGAGYVIRRILRRAIRYGFTFLNKKEAFIHQLVETLCAEMGNAFPELNTQKTLIYNVIKEEEQSFLKTLEQGLLLLENITANTVDTVISGRKVFELKDTYGFPEDLTALILSEKGLEYDKEAYKTALKEQQNRGREATAIETDDWKILSESTDEEFVGYDTLETSSKIVRYRKVTSKKDGEQYQIVLNTTPFYPEGGGQVGDKGQILTAEGEVIPVLSTKKENNLIVHFTKKLPANTTAVLTAKVNAEKRQASASNHSATHLLHEALRTVLGTHVAQKGSMVNADYLRFDFSHFSKVTPEELQQVSDIVNTKINAQIPLVERRNIPFQQAIDEGAMALFGEKYGDNVRAIKFESSMELCGGTHVKNTSDIWHFVLKSEGAVASGVRRIEAITGAVAKEYFTEQAASFSAVKLALKNTKSPLKAIVTLQDENTMLKKQVEQLLKEKAGGLKDSLKQEITTVNGVNFLAKQIDLDAKGIKDLAHELGGELDNLFLFFGAENQGKATLTCYISKKLAADKNLHAGTIVRELGKHINGGGGGQPFFATAGGKNPAGINAALEAVKSYIS